MSKSNEYAIESVVLTSTTGKETEIKDLIISVDFYESLLSPYIKCELTISDATNLIEVIPIIGQEHVKLVIKDSNINNKITREFYVASVQNYFRANAQSSMYVLKLVTPEYMMNSLLLVSQAYTGQISKSVEAIVRDYLKSKMKVNEESNGEYKVIIPNWNPFKAIEWLSRRGLTARGYPYAFYETLIDGYHFESYETIFNKKVVTKYTHRGNNATKDDAEQTSAMLSTALKYEIVEMSNTGKHILRGTFGSGMHIVDHANRSYKFATYDYDKDFQNKPRMEKYPYIADQFKVNNKKISEYAAQHGIQYKNSLAFENLNNYNNLSEFTKLEADPLVAQMSLVKLNATIKGRSDLTVGKVIDFEVEQNKPVAGNTTKNANLFLTGKYVVENIHHKMEDGKYVMIVDIIKESLGREVK